MTRVNIRIEDDIKERAEAIFSEPGMNLTTAFNIFVRQTVREGGVPFAVTTKPDPFRNAANMKILRQSIEEANEGKLTAPGKIISTGRSKTKKFSNESTSSSKTSNGIPAMA